MLKLFRKIQKTTLILGIICSYLAISTSDYHTIVMEENNPNTVFVLMGIGMFLFIPSIITLIQNYINEVREDNVFHR